MPLFVDSALTGMSPTFISQGNVLNVDSYRSVTIFEVQLGTASSTAWRLCGCILIGTLATPVATEVCWACLTLNGPPA